MINFGLFGLAGMKAQKRQEKSWAERQNTIIEISHRNNASRCRTESGTVRCGIPLRVNFEKKRFAHFAFPRKDEQKTRKNVR